MGDVAWGVKCLKKQNGSKDAKYIFYITAENFTPCKVTLLLKTFLPVN